MTTPTRNRDVVSFVLAILGGGALLLPQVWSGDLLVSIALLGCLLIAFRFGCTKAILSSPFLLILFISCLTRLCILTDLQLLLRTLQASCAEGSCWDFGRVIAAMYMPALRSMGSAIPLCIYVFLTTFLVHRTEYRYRMTIGVVIGACIAACIMSIQYAGFLETTYVSQDDFWRSINRFGGIASDPNALGIVAYLIIGLLLVHRRNFSKRYLLDLLIAAWIFFGLIAGSRTFVLGIVIAALCLLWKHQRRLFWMACVLFLCCVVSLQLAAVDLHNLPLSLERVINSLSDPDAFFSRIVFWRAGMRLWLLFPFTGIGFGQFQRYFPDMARALGYSLAGWNDNANSMYLSILSELGLIGCAALAVSAQRFKWRDNQSLARAFAIGFLVQLIFGPHLYFPEVAILASLLFGYALELREGEQFSGYIIWLASLAVFGLNLLSHWNDSVGIVWHGPTRFSIMRQGTVQLVCDTPMVSLDMQPAYTPKEPFFVRVTTDSGLETSLSLSDSGTIHHTFPCAQETRISIECSRFWLPHLIGGSGDVRPRCVTVQVVGAHHG